MEIEFIRSRVSTHTDPDEGLVHTGEKGSQETIPERKYGSVVGIPLFDDHTMVYPMHGWWNKEDPEECLKPFGDS